MSTPPGRQLDKRRVAQHFAAAAAAYEDHDALQREVATRLEERLDYVTLDVERLLDLGSGTGRLGRLLARRYRHALIVESDLALPMLATARARAPRWFSRHRHVCADAEHLPFAANAFDLVLSSLALQWCEDLPAVFAGTRGALREGGLFLFATLGPDTLRELRAAFAATSSATHVNRFIDMHDIGDMLGHAGFADPVMETEYLTVEYADVLTLMRDLKGIGAGNAQLERTRGLFGRRQLRALTEAYEAYRRDGLLPATYEVVYGHAWAVTPRPAKPASEQYFPLERLRRRT
ncbi:MAG: malonyl-ACP O-methyltransferase BioC [Gammaproteobacteria bacterium]|nr:malonyl-ACP O-methyltransferase BioC [Gammaproteobacteria bacterium]MCP5200549.1 malonyl-ACP O-methyltransferase BioC [Gammaproteobacteria bacterium]